MTANQIVRPQTTSRWVRLATPRAALIFGLATLLLVIAAVPLAFVSRAGSSGLPLVPFAIVGYVVTRTAAAEPDRVDPDRARLHVPARLRRRELCLPRLSAGLPPAARPAGRVPRRVLGVAAHSRSAPDRALSRRRHLPPLGLGGLDLFRPGRRGYRLLHLGRHQRGARAARPNRQPGRIPGDRREGAGRLLRRRAVRLLAGRGHQAGAQLSQCDPRAPAAAEIAAQRRRHLDHRASSLGNGGFLLVVVLSIGVGRRGSSSTGSTRSTG